MSTPTTTTDVTVPSESATAHLYRVLVEIGSTIRNLSQTAVEALYSYLGTTKELLSHFLRLVQTKKVQLRRLHAGLWRRCVRHVLLTRRRDPTDPRV